MFHSSGVTSRSPEIHLLNRNLPIIFVDDFSVSNATHKLGSSRPIIFKLSRIPKKILSLLGFVDSLDSPGGNPKTKLRTVQFRGHYTYFALEPDLLKELILLSDESGSPIFAFDEPFLENQIGIHFRLGDLLNLESKNYLNPERISVLIEAQLSEPDSEVVVYTDSLEEFYGLVRDELKIENVSAFSSDPIITIQALVRSRIFIGTTSKISVWICIFRCLTMAGGISYMPIEMKKSLDTQLRNLDSSGVHYYS